MRFIISIQSIEAGFNPPFYDVIIQPALAETYFSLISL